MNKLAQLLMYVLALMVTATFAEQELGVKEESTPEETAPKGAISIRYKLKWDALWPYDSTEEQVSKEERLEYLNEALIEIGYKMKRKHQQKSLTKFTITDYENEFVEADYPNLKGADGISSPTNEELKQVALQLLTTGIVNTVNMLRDGEQVDIFQNEEFRKLADEKLFQAQSQRRMSADEYRLKKEREQKAKKNQEEFEEFID